LRKEITVIDEKSIEGSGPQSYYHFPSRHDASQRKALIESILRDAREGRPAGDLLRYAVALEEMPASGGNGCHTGLLRVANIGRASGVSPEDVATDLRDWVRDDAREVTPAEIAATVKKAFGTSPPPPRAQRCAPPALRAAIMARGAGATEQTLIEASPMKLNFPVERSGIELIECLYGVHDKLFIGGEWDAGPRHICTATDWLLRFERKPPYPTPQYIIPNPLSGRWGMTKDNTKSLRADSCVAQFRYAVVEMDGTPLPEQVQFWAGVRLPVVALIFSGNKSIHGWVRANCRNAEEWERDIEQDFFDLLKNLGVDKSNKNESRLSRFPGHFRAEKRQWQRLLYLAPWGRPVQP
jgi:hypothetical protein